MTGCVAPDYTNSDEKGFIMKIFPRDPVRRAQWAANVNRKEWIPTERSFLCEVHFSHDMWENNRVDGKRKLKINAVPTIFGSEAKKIKSYRKNMRHASLNDEVGCVHEYNVSVQSIQNEEANSDGQNKMQLESVKSKKGNSELKNMSRTINKHKQIICEQSRIIKNQNIRLRKFKKCLLTVQRDLKLEKKQKNQSNYAALLSKLKEIFTDDQIAVLKNNKRVQKWSNISIMKALQLRFSCGITGYEELRRQKLPLPGLRTLRRKIEL